MSGQSPATEAHFGPPSELIKVTDFLHEVAELEQSSHSVFTQSADSLADVAQREWMALSEERRAAIEAECRYVFPSSVSRGHIKCSFYRSSTQLQIFLPSFARAARVSLTTG